MGQQIYGDIEEMRRTRKVGTNVAPGTPKIIQGRACVTYTGSGDFEKSASIDFGNGNVWSFAAQGGGIGHKATEATVSYFGTWAFDVEGATVTAAYDADGNGKPVYIKPDGTLTLSADDGAASPDTVEYTKFGVVDFFRGEDSLTDTAVQIGL